MIGGTKLYIANDAPWTMKCIHLRWPNTILRAVSGNLPDGACFKLEEQTWQQKKQWNTEDDFSKSTH